MTGPFTKGIVGVLQAALGLGTLVSDIHEVLKLLLTAALLVGAVLSIVAGWRQLRREK